MTKIKLGINLNCFTNRYPEPEEWTKLVNELGLHYVQFNADIIDPFLPEHIQQRIIKKTLELCEQRNIKICSSFGGHNHHQNYLGHPDEEVAVWYENFYKKLITQTALLKADGVGTCFAIMSVKDAANKERKKEILNRAARAYIGLSKYAKEKGLKYLLFETTSVPRETCATFEETDYVLSILKDMEIPMKLCLDMGHINMEDPTAPEADPYGWVKRYGKIAPVIHIQQTDNSASCHWPFTSKYNKMGNIDAKKLIQAINQSGAEECVLAFEIDEKAFFPHEYKVIDDLKESIEYWRRLVKK